MDFQAPLPSNLSANSSRRQPKNSARSSFCRICSDQARFFNYGVLSCQSCKTFFRRNGLRVHAIRPCSARRMCKINVQSRRICTACRLKKCLMMGMSTDFIRKEDAQNVRQPFDIGGAHRQLIPYGTLMTPRINADLPVVDRFALVDSDWRLLSNIIHAYDTFTTNLHLQHFLATLPLSSFDHHEFLNLSQVFTHIQSAFQSFIGSSPDFRILTTSEQRSLFRRNLPGIIGFGSIFFFHQPDSVYSNLLARIYRPETTASLNAINRHLASDSTLVKVFLLVLAFSSNCSMMIIDEHENNDHDFLLLGTYRLFGSQNVYLELLWKYLIARYGYPHAAQQFSRLIEVFLCVLQNFGSLHVNDRMHRQLFSETEVRTRRFLRSHQNDQSLLWGRT